MAKINDIRKLQKLNNKKAKYFIDLYILPSLNLNANMFSYI